MTNNITILLADDHSLVRDGIRALLEDEKNFKVVGEASNGQEAIEKIESLKPDIALIDIRMPLLNGIETIRKVAKSQTHTHTIVLSMHDSEEYVLQSIEAGAYGYLLKDTPREELLKAIQKVSEGEKYFSGDISKIVVNKYLENLKPQETLASSENAQPAIELGKPLTKRELQILRLILAGQSNKEIAEQLNKSVRTIETHRFNLMQKLQAKNLADLARKAEIYAIQ